MLPRQPSPIRVRHVREPTACDLWGEEVHVLPPRRPSQALAASQLRRIAASLEKAQQEGQLRSIRSQRAGAAPS